jgi:hypothetical protein
MHPSLVLGLGEICSPDLSQRPIDSNRMALAQPGVRNRGAVLSERGSVHQVRDRTKKVLQRRVRAPDEDKMFWHSLEFVIEAQCFLSEGAYIRYVTERRKCCNEEYELQAKTKSFGKVRLA